MTIEKFIDGYNKSTNKEGYVKKHILNEYVPYLTKIEDCEIIANTSCYKKNNDQIIYHKDSVIEYILFVLCLLQRYTDLELSDDKFNDYDLLNKNNLIEIITNFINEYEYSQYRNILKAKTNDIHINETNIVSWMNNKIPLIFASLVPILENNIGNNNEQ